VIGSGSGIELIVLSRAGTSAAAAEFMSKSVGGRRRCASAAAGRLMLCGTISRCVVQVQTRMQIE